MIGEWERKEGMENRRGINDWGMGEEGRNGEWERNE